jgi:hypothetical protein
MNVHSDWFILPRVLGGILATGRRWTAILDQDRLAAITGPWTPAISALCLWPLCAEWTASRPSETAWTTMLTQQPAIPMMSRTRTAMADQAQEP